ncbi:MAG TPA: serine hydrolase domain-containing protein, partial [Acidobacteriaceae bacterium]|nr:serine hydrolase domain-containing protein [Acidobacteriaceae bacterium]
IRTYMMGGMLRRSGLLFGTLLIFGILLIPSAGFAQDEALHQRFDAVLKQHGIVGGGIAVVHGQAPATEFFYGVMKAGSDQRVDGATTYNWASITKTLTAIAILQLRDRGKLSLDDPAVKYVPELRQIHDEFGPVDAITIRDLLTHSAGFRNPTWPWDCDDTSNCDWQPFEPTHWAQVAAMLPYTHIAFKPGSQWSYSNPGYVFLGQIIERLSGDDYEIYITKNILMPLGMTASYFDVSPYYLERRVSASYLRAGSKLTEQPFDFDTGITTSNSGLKAPITDMEKYARFLLGDAANPVYDVVLKRSSLEEAWTGVLPVMGEEATAYTKDAPKMGLGFFVLRLNGHRYVYHDGDQGGFSSELFLDPERHAAGILAVNTTDTGAPAPSTELHPQSNTEPEPSTDLRLTLRQDLIDHVFPALAAQSGAGQSR